MALRKLAPQQRSGFNVIATRPGLIVSVSDQLVTGSTHLFTISYSVFDCSVACII